MNRDVGYLVDRVSFAIRGLGDPDSHLKDEIKAQLGFSLIELVSMGDFPPFRDTETLSLAQCQDVYQLHETWERMIEPGVVLETDPRRPLRQIYQQDIDEYPRTTSPARPTCYALLGRSETTGRQKIRFYPMPDQSYTVSYRFFSTPELIGPDTADTTVVDQRFSSIFLPGLVAKTVMKFPQFLTEDQIRDAGITTQATIDRMRSMYKSAAGQSFQKKRYRRSGTRTTNVWPYGFEDV